MTPFMLAITAGLAFLIIEIPALIMMGKIRQRSPYRPRHSKSSADR